MSNKPDPQQISPVVTNPCRCSGTSRPPATGTCSHDKSWWVYKECMNSINNMVHRILPHCRQKGVFAEMSLFYSALTVAFQGGRLMQPSDMSYSSGINSEVNMFAHITVWWSVVSLHWFPHQTPSYSRLSLTYSDTERDSWLGALSMSSVPLPRLREREDYLSRSFWRRGFEDVWHYYWYWQMAGGVLVPWLTSVACNWLLITFSDL